MWHWWQTAAERIQMRDADRYINALWLKKESLHSIYLTSQLNMQGLSNALHTFV